MSNSETKGLAIDVKDLSLDKEQYVEDLLRFLSEQLPSIELSRNANKIDVQMPSSMSRKVLKLRLKKFLHQKALKDKYRPIAFRTPDDDQGFMIKEKKTIELTYY
jgi:hypothetical protein